MNKFRGAQDVVRYNVETDRGTITQDPDWIYDDVEFQPLDEIHFVERHSDQVDESKGTCPLRFSLVSGKDV